MKRPLPAFAAAFVFIALAHPPADAQESAIETHFRAGHNACYTLVHSRAYLKSHPGEELSYISVRYFAPKKGSEFYDAERMAPRLGRQVEVTVNARFRGVRHVYTAQAICVLREGAVRCGLDCDAGSFHLSARGEKKLLLTGLFGIGDCEIEEEDKSICRDISRKSPGGGLMLYKERASRCRK